MKRMICCVLMVVLLSGCKAKTESGECSVLQKASQMDDNAILLQINGREQPAWRYLYWLAKDMERVQAQYQQAGMEPDWNAAPEDGSTLAGYVKEQALADTALYAVVEEWAERYDCTAEETAATADPLLTEEQAKVMAAVGGKYRALMTYARQPDSPLAPAAGELELFAAENGAVQIDRIFIKKSGDGQEAKQKAEESFARLNRMEVTPESFAELAAAGDDTAGPRLLEESGWDTALTEAANTLQMGQTSGILETAEGFSILYRLTQDTKTMQEAYFDCILQEAARQSDIQVTGAYDGLDLSAFFAVLRENGMKS